MKLLKNTILHACKTRKQGKEHTSMLSRNIGEFHGNKMMEKIWRNYWKLKDWFDGGMNEWHENGLCLVEGYSQTSYTSSNTRRLLKYVEKRRYITEILFYEGYFKKIENRN